MLTLSKLLAPSTWIDQFLSRPELPSQLCTSCGFEGVPVRRKKGHDQVELLLWALFAACALLYVITLSAHHASHFRFPGLIVRMFSLLTKLFLASGVIYTTWQLSTESPVCSKCSRETLIPSDSPKAGEFRR